MNTNEAKTLDMLNVIGLRESIDTLLSKESKYVPVASICKAYLKRLDEGEQEEALANDFYAELSKVAVHESTKDVLFNLNSKLENGKRDIENINRLNTVKNGRYGYIVPMIESAVVNYMIDKNSDTRSTLKQTLSLFEGIKEIDEIIQSLVYDEYDEKSTPLYNQQLKESANVAKTYTEEEVNKMIEDATAAAKISENVVEHKKLSDIDTHINLDATIKTILKNNTNEGLRAFCEQYINALNTGKAEETLYESFISGLSRWNYLSAVDTEASALKDRVSKYQQDIDLKKILRIMENTGSYYIVPLIEEVVADYIDNKSMANKAILKQRLQAFEYDPFVRDILNVVMLDQSLNNTVYLGESLESINTTVHTEKIYSPVKYIKENECVFNVKGTYYTRKGNTVTKLSKSSIANLDESFKTLCNLINHPAVQIDDLANVISIYEGSDSIKISETDILFNGNSVTSGELKSIAEQSHLMNEHKEGLFAAAQMINENFNKIAYIDFVKRVAMNESNGKAVDVFRIKDNIFVNTSNANDGTSTFYRNVNPIQCRSYINEHMEINVSSLFEDILPNQHAILEGIEETKQEYENYIDELNNRKSQFEELKDSSEDTKDIDDAIKIIEDEIKDVEKKYEDFKKKSEEYVTGDDKADSDKSDDTADTDEVPSRDSSTDETPAETPDEMTAPIQGDDTATATGEDVYVDPDQEAIDSATPYDSDFDVVAGGNEKAEVKVLRISYSENVKTGKKSNQGTAYLVIPSVDANGDIKDETKTVTFYLDADRKPVINNDYMPLMVYNSIINAIADDPDTAAIEVGETSSSEVPAATEPETSVASVDVTTAEVPVSSEEVPSEPAVPEVPAVDSVSAPISSDTSLDSSIDSLPAPEEVSPEDEPMFGVEDETGITSDNVDSSVNADDSAPAEFGTDGDFGTDDEIPSADYLDFDSSSNDTAAPEESPADSSTDDSNTPVDAAPEESPAETESRSEDDTYPIELGLNMNDIKPITKESFCKACEDMCVECGVVEGEEDSVTLKFANKAAVYALKDYFKEWKNFSETQFITFFPELKKCFENKPKVPVAPAKANESVSILGVSAINESTLYTDNSKGCVKVVLPMNEAYCKLFNIPMKKNNSHIEIEAESLEESKEIYQKLNTYSLANNGNIDEDAKSFLERYKNDFAEISESKVYVVNVPYNNFLEKKLNSKGIQVARIDENLNIAIEQSDCKKAKRIFESVYGESAPVEVRDFFQLSESLLKEGVVITVEDTKTGKTVKIDTSELDSGNSSDEKEEKKDEQDPFKDTVTTFNSSDSALFNSDDKDSDEENSNESEKDDASGEDNEKESTENKEDVEKEAPRKKFKFRPKKKTDESVVETKSVKTSINESLNEVGESSVKQAAPNVLDWVEIGNGQKGQIIASLPMSGNFIVNCSGRTIEVSPKAVKPLKFRPDTVEAPYKFDPKTLKGLFEQMVHCGMFMNGNQITPDNKCFVKYSEYINASEDDDIRLMIESEQVFAKKKYVKITEDVNDFANINDYVEGIEITADGYELRNILFNIKDYSYASGSSSPVRVLVADDSGERHLINLPAGSIKPTEM